MKERNIKLGCGYQSVQGRGVAQIVSKLDEETTVISKEPKFDYKAKFCESSEELHRELSASLNLSATISNISPEISGNFSKISDNNNYVRYYFIELQQEKSRKTLNIPRDSDKLSKNFIDLNKAHLDNKEEFYRKYGDNFVSEVVYGEKLIVVIELTKDHKSKISKWSLSPKLTAPITPGVSISGGASISSVLNSLQESEVSNIHIYSIGNNTPNLQLDVVKNIGDLRDKLQSFVDKKPDKSDLKSSIPAKQQSAKNNKKSDSNKDEDTEVTTTVVTTFKNIDSSKLASAPLATGAKDNTKATDDKKNNASDDSLAVISFSTSSYLSLLSEDDIAEQKGIKKFYDKILQATNRSNSYLKAISACYIRAKAFLNNISYGFNNGEALNLNRAKKDVLLSHEKIMNDYLKNLEDLAKKIFANIFNDNFGKKTDNSAITWDERWNEILLIGKNLDLFMQNLPSDTAIPAKDKPIPPLIDYQNSAILVGEFTSLYKTNGTLRRISSNKSNMLVPFETEHLNFKVDQAGHENIVDLQFKLRRSSSIHINGHKSSHHTLYKDLTDGATRDPLFPDLDPLLKLAPDKNMSQEYRLFFSPANKYNSKIYEDVAIAEPTYRLPNKVFASPGPYATFTVKVYAQTGPSLKPLNLPTTAPVGEVSYEPYSGAVDSAPADFQRTDISILLNSVNHLTDRLKALGIADPVITRAPDFAKLETQKDSGFTMSDPWYSNIHVTELLKYYLKDKQNIELFAEMLGTDIIKGSNMLAANLSEFIQDRFNKISHGEVVKDKILIPVNLSKKHWVLVAINLKKDAAILPDIYYIDPYGHSVNEDVSEALKTVFPDVATIDLDSPFQEEADGDNCGPWIIEIAKYLADLDDLADLEKNVGDIKIARNLQMQDFSKITSTKSEVLHAPSTVAPKSVMFALPSQTTATTEVDKQSSDVPTSTISK